MVLGSGNLVGFVSRVRIAHSPWLQRHLLKFRCKGRVQGILGVPGSKSSNFSIKRGRAWRAASGYFSRTLCIAKMARLRI